MQKMSDERMQYYAIKGLVAEASAEDQAKFDAAYKEIKEAVSKHAEYGPTALALLGFEVLLTDK